MTLDLAIAYAALVGWSITLTTAWGDIYPWSCRLIRPNITATHTHEACEGHGDTPADALSAALLHGRIYPIYPIPAQTTTDRPLNLRALLGRPQLKALRR